MLKNILITSGGTSEPIDRIRSITNTSTGTLGSLIAKAFSAADSTENIYYIHGKNAILPDCGKLVRQITFSVLCAAFVKSAGLMLSFTAWLSVISVCAP